MPNSKAVNKTASSARRKRLRNRLVRSSARTHMSKARKSISRRELELAQQETVTAISSIDKAVSKGIFHRNKGARLKSRLTRKLNAVVAAGQNLEHSEEEVGQS